jgi:hypothetical protein
VGVAALCLSGAPLGGSADAALARKGGPKADRSAKVTERRKREDRKRDGRKRTPPRMLAGRSSDDAKGSTRVQMVRAAVAIGLFGAGAASPGNPAPTEPVEPPAQAPPAATPPPTTPSDPPPPAPASLPRAFAPNSFWNEPLAPDAPLDPMSEAYTAELQRQLDEWMPWINTTAHSVPVYTVPADQPTVRVQLDNSHAALQAAWERVPIPPDAKPAAGSDAWMVVWQPATDTMWEFWRAEKRADGWHAVFGGRMRDVSSNPGHYTDPPGWGASATSIPILGGLIRIDELRAGRIDHALALAIPQPKAGAWSWPAQRTDGRNTSPNAIPAGTRFRIDPAVDLSKLPMSPVVRQMAVAAQRYGIVVRDTAGSVAFYAEDPTPTGTNPYSGPTGFFRGQYPSKLLAQFPWEHLQALQTDIRTKR